MISNKKIAITGHTSGIGKTLFEHFLSKNTVIGFSRSNSFDITLTESRKEILTKSNSCDIFINNAYNNFDDSQLFMLMEIYELWLGKKDKLIINISSRYTNDYNMYCETKTKQDKFIEKHLYDFPKIINLKPGLIDTPRVRSLKGNKINPEVISTVVDLIFDTRETIGINSITFSPY